MKPGPEIPRVASLRTVQRFQQHLQSLGVALPCDEELAVGAESPLAQPLNKAGFKIGNRVAIHPMEGWDGTADGNPGESTLRRWRRFGQSGAKLIWGG
ncbi:MAG TPA: NADH:flavin oxidoreductase, partial [Terriglobia bacterium]|nr:NADH:flavin oxidoreductase [Terriglobia bacterium]